MVKRRDRRRLEALKVAPSTPPSLHRFLSLPESRLKKLETRTALVDLVTVLKATMDIMASRQPREKLLCLYGNLMSNNFVRLF